MTRAHGAVQLAFAALLTTGCSFAHGGDSKTGPSQPETRRLDKETLNADLRAAVFQDRRWLVDVIGERDTRRAICVPPPNDSYELFQATVREDLEVLWDLDANSSSYGLNKPQREAVLDCARLLGEYEDNFDAWRRLIKESKRP